MGNKLKLFILIGLLALAGGVYWQLDKQVEEQPTIKNHKNKAIQLYAAVRYNELENDYLTIQDTQVRVIFSFDQISEDTSHLGISLWYQKECLDCPNPVFLLVEKSPKGEEKITTRFDTHAEQNDTNQTWQSVAFTADLLNANHNYKLTVKGAEGLRIDNLFIGPATQIEAIKQHNKQPAN